MAIYHFSAEIIARDNGQSACAAAAYRSGEVITSEYDGITHDYRNKYNVVRTVILLPEHAPSEYSDRSTLWNAVEMSEKAKNAQLARGLEFSLPLELSEEEREKLAIDFVQREFVSKGMIADLCFHNPPKLDSHKHPVDKDGHPTDNPAEYVYDNPHVHVLLTMRPLTDDGKWAAKKTKLYICEKDGVQQTFTAEELKKHKGWEKLYQYKLSNGKTEFHTKSYAEAHPNECVEQVNRYPKSTQIINPEVERWNSKEQLLAWREAWADAANAALEAAGMNARIDHRSYKDQGLDLIPGIKEGKAVTIEEKRLQEEYDADIAAGRTAVEKHTEIRKRNIAIKEHNREIRIVMELEKLRIEMQTLLRSVTERIAAAGSSIAEMLERLRAEIITGKINIRKSKDQKWKVDNHIKQNTEYIKDISPVRLEKIKEAKKEIQNLKTQRESLGIFDRKKKEILQEKITDLQDQLRAMQEDRQLAKNTKEEISLLQKQSEFIDEQIQKDMKSVAENIAKYQKTEKNIPEDKVENVRAERLKCRKSVEEKYIEKTGKKEFLEEAEKTDVTLGFAPDVLSDDDQKMDGIKFG